MAATATCQIGVGDFLQVTALKVPNVVESCPEAERYLMEHAQTKSQRLLRLWDRTPLLPDVFNRPLLT